MRIIAGSLGGRAFDSPGGHKTHPMSDRVRGGLFNALGDIGSLTVLDAFAGTGALSFEAVSRGASSAVAIDADKNAYKTIRENIESLQLGKQVKAIQANVSGWSDNNADTQFDLVLLDPPFDKLQPSVLEKLTKHVKQNGLIVLSWPSRETAPTFENLNTETVKEKHYGDAELIFYRKV